MAIEQQMQRVEFPDVEATLSAMIDQAQMGQPSIITRHGWPVVVILSFDEWQRLSEVASFGRLLMASPLEADDLPARSGSLRGADL